MFSERGETPVGIRGVNRIWVENGKARPMHMSALESAPPNPPE